MKNTSAAPSLEKIWEGNALYGVWNRLISVANVAGTGASGTSGMVSAVKVCQIPVPSVAAPVIGLTLRANLLMQTVPAIAGLEYLLGTLTVSGNSFSAGVTMPIKKVRGEDVQTNADVVLARVSATLVGATTPVLTLTYTNQNGTGSRTATLTLPSNPLVNSCFFIPHHFQADDTAMYALTGASISAGTSGAIEFYGILPFSRGINTGVLGASTDFISAPEVPYMGVSGENIGIYKFITVTAAENIMHIQGIPEV